MAITKDTIIMEFLVDNTQAVAELSKFSSIGRQMGTLEKQGMKTGYIMKQLKQDLGENSQAFKVLNNSMKEIKNRFDMNTLSWMFGGMALHRYSMMALRFFVPSMEKMEKLNTEGAKKVIGMTAAFEFLKISIFETLSQTPLFKEFVDQIVRAALWISEFAQKHPNIVAIAAALAGIGVVLGGLAMGVGVFMQLSHLITLLGVGGVAGEAAVATTALETLGAVKLTTIIASAGILAAAVAATALVLIKLKADIDAMTSDLTEQGAPKIEDSYLAGADNTQQLINNFEDFNLEWSNLRAGIDRTIAVQTTFNTTTGEFNKHIITAQDELKGVNEWGQKWLEQNSLLDTQLREKNIISVDSYTQKLNAIPREITTTVTTNYVNNYSNSGSSKSQGGSYMSSLGSVT